MGISFPMIFIVINLNDWTGAGTGPVHHVMHMLIIFPVLNPVNRGIAKERDDVFPKRSPEGKFFWYYAAK